MIVPVVVLVVFTVIGVLVVRALWDRFGSGGSGQGRALSILQQRYARGEIDRDEFELRKGHLIERGR